MHHIIEAEKFCNFKNQSVFVIDSQVFKLHQKDLAHIPLERVLLIDKIAQAKSWEQLQEVLNFFSLKNLPRDATVYAIGGGTLTDLVGFAASIFKRGIGLVLVPTTLLSMIDASIGGKNGIDFVGVKNLIGTFYPASEIHIIETFLKTLSQNQILSGFAEAFKIALVSSKSLFETLSLENLNPSIIKSCINLKLEIAAQDPLDQGIRHILNFGHTFGHAYEAITKLEHGLCVAVGMMAETFISFKDGFLSFEDYQTITAKLKSLYQGFPKVSFDELMHYLSKDKKHSTHGLMLHRLHAIGQAPKLQQTSFEQIFEGYQSLWI